VCEHRPVTTLGRSERRSGAQSAGRALAVLRCFETAPGDLGVTEIATRTGLTVSTAHRLARALCDGGLLIHDPRRERYRLGPTLVVLGRKAEAQLGYAQVLPILEELATATGESVNLGIRAGSEVLVVLDVASSQPLRFEQAPGSRVPVHTSAMGKCLLAYTPDPAREVEQLAPLAPVTDRTITAQADLVAELERTRTRGWALNDEERNPGVRAIAAPVLDPEGRAVAAIAVQGPALRLTDDRLADLAPAVMQAAATLSPLLVAASP
jgi:IclR family transcriptional regulator, acetate operon repressor